MLMAMPLFAGSLAYPQENKDRPIRYVRGRISNINYPGSKITVQWLYSTNKISDDKITFYVPDSARVFTKKGGAFKSDWIVNLMVRDHIIIKYYDDKKMGLPEIITIRVLEHDKPIPP